MIKGGEQGVVVAVVEVDVVVDRILRPFDFHESSRCVCLEQEKVKTRVYLVYEQIAKFEIWERVLTILSTHASNYR